MNEFEDKYEGSKNKDGLPHGKGKHISFGVDGKISLIEEGIWKNGFLVEGSETIFGNQQNDGSYAIKKEVGKWRFDEKKNYCEEYLSGEGEELYYKNEEDFKNDKPMGYVKGIFDDGSLLKGEVYNAYLIRYSEERFIKKIIIDGKAKKNSVKIKLGKVFFENGDRYEGEIEYDMPQGKGTMYYKEDGTHLEGEWVDGNFKK
ncbi:hypothetical protein OA337_02095 [Candidatus Pelagibacter sp.]|nr:hypothetical protein [Candidatus Pelagibacter sp.]